MATQFDLEDPDVQRYVKMLYAQQLVSGQLAPRRQRWGFFDYLTFFIVVVLIGAVAVMAAPRAIELYLWYKSGMPVGDQAQPTATLMPWQPPAKQQQPQAQPQEPQAPASAPAEAPLAPVAPAELAPAEIQPAVINVPTIDPNVVIVPQPNSVHATAIVPTAIPQAVLNAGATAYTLASTPATPVPLQSNCNPPFTVQMAVVKDGVPTGQVTGVGCSQAEAEANARTLAAQMGGQP